MQGFNEIKTKFRHEDGREFDAELCKFIKFKYGQEPDHMRNGFQVIFDWGLCTQMFYDVERTDHKKVGEFLTTVMDVVGASSNDIIGKPFYVLFDPEIRHRIRGIASLNAMHTAFIFADFYEEN